MSNCLDHTCLCLFVLVTCFMVCLRFELFEISSTCPCLLKIDSPLVSNMSFSNFGFLVQHSGIKFSKPKVNNELLLFRSPSFVLYGKLCLFCLCSHLSKNVQISKMVSRSSWARVIPTWPRIGPTWAGMVQCQHFQSAVARFCYVTDKTSIK